MFLWFRLRFLDTETCVPETAVGTCHSFSPRARLHVKVCTIALARCRAFKSLDGRQNVVIVIVVKSPVCDMSRVSDRRTWKCRNKSAGFGRRSLTLLLVPRLQFPRTVFRTLVFPSREDHRSGIHGDRVYQTTLKCHRPRSPFGFTNTVWQPEHAFLD